MANSDSFVETAEAGPVHSITMPHDEPELPPGKGRELVVAGCVTCHSPRYITNQPRFPRSTWTEEVNKMVKTFGAPIPPEQVPAIVDYLVAWHGREDSK